MAFLLLDPADHARVAAAVEILNLAGRTDDPEAWPALPVLLSRYLRYGWDLECDSMYLYAPDESSTPVGVLSLSLPRHDNLHLMEAEVTVHPDHRRQGHGSAMVTEVTRQTRAAGRKTIWMGAPEDDLGARAFLERFGFRAASRDARRRQVLADLDAEAVEQLRGKAQPAAADYLLERQLAPTPANVLEELVEVTAAINDAPMGDLTFEDERFDLRRLQDIETAAAGREDRLYRVWARHRSTGRVGGHTMMIVNPLRPEYAQQGDTAVSRHHRGHRLGLLLKVEMMGWLAQQEPQLQQVETWNQADNEHMIEVNEAVGYRLSRMFATYELTLDT